MLPSASIALRNTGANIFIPAPLALPAKIFLCTHLRSKGSLHTKAF